MSRILLYRLGSLGDTVVALPCLHLLRRVWPSAEITLLTNVPVASKAPPAAQILENSGLINGLLEYPAELRNWSQIRRLRSTIRAQRFDLCIHLAAPRGLRNSIRDYFFFRSCGIPKIIGVPWRKPDLQPPRLPSGLYEREAARLARRLLLLGPIDLVAPESWDLRLTAEELKAADDLLTPAGISGKFLAVSVGTKIPVKDWGEANWTALFRRLQPSLGGTPLVAIGAKEEFDLTQRCVRGWPGTVANLCGATSPRVSAAILRKAALFLGHDSGPMHLAAAVGTRCIAIFSAHGLAGQWFPNGPSHINILPSGLCPSFPSCNLASAPAARQNLALALPPECKQVNGQCILTIKVDQVAPAMQAALGQ